MVEVIILVLHDASAEGDIRSNLPYHLDDWEGILDRRLNHTSDEIIGSIEPVDWGMLSLARNGTMKYAPFIVAPFVAANGCHVSTE